MSEVSIDPKGVRADPTGGCGGSASPGELILHILAGFESKGLPYVYLRNYEDLPDSVGHDVDLLVAKGRRSEALGLTRLLAKERGWSVVRCATFSPLAVFLVNHDGSRSVHLDLFDRVERHWLEFASSERIVKNRQFNGLVFCPSPGDEIFVSVCTRLIYLGLVREKHRKQVNRMVSEGRESDIRKAFEDHLGLRFGGALGDAVVNEDWLKVESSFKEMRRVTWWRWGVRTPWSAIVGIGRYFGRTVSRIARPPGPFVVLEGADGSGKSTVIGGLISSLEELTGIADTLRFHWKPQRKSIFVAGSNPPAIRDPRARPPRSAATSIVFLAYHWLGFWFGWFRYLYRALTMSRPVVGDRYAYDLQLDPLRFRLALPNWILVLAVRTVPKPDLVIALSADPELVVARKPELSCDEVHAYQQGLGKLAEDYDWVRIVDAGRPVDDVSSAIRDEVIKWMKRVDRP